MEEPYYHTFHLPHFFLINLFIMSPAARIYLVSRFVFINGGPGSSCDLVTRIKMSLEFDLLAMGMFRNNPNPTNPVKKARIIMIMSFSSS